VTAHAQKPDFVFRLNGRVHLNRRGASVHSTTGRRAVYSSLQGLYCSCKPVFCSHVTLTGYPLHSLVSPSLLLPCVTVCHHISDAVYFTCSCFQVLRVSLMRLVRFSYGLGRMLSKFRSHISFTDSNPFVMYTKVKLPFPVSLQHDGNIFT
jgi:hypothetical protein